MYKSYIFILLSLGLFSCSEKNPIEITKIPDYSNKFNWASIPEMMDKNVDVFWVYPTLFGNIDQMNMDIKDEEMRQRVQVNLLKQASVFKESCNIIAPFYRQMGMDGLSLDPVDREKYFSIGLDDIKHAFEYYMKNMNNGRPFIIAGHSQGSQILIQLMKDCFGKLEIRDKMVAAYLIGYSVTLGDLESYPHLKIAQSDNDNGVIITYNSQTESALGSPVLLENALCTNPLNWKSSYDLEYAPKELHLGALVFKQNGEIDSVIPQFTDALANSLGALIITIPENLNFPINGFPEGVYHQYDYSFFYNNLKENVQLRIDAYIEDNQN